MNYVSELTIDYKTYKRMALLVPRKRIVWHILRCIIFNECISFLFWNHSKWICLYFSFGVLVYYLAAFLKLKLEYRKLVALNKGKQPHTVVILDSEGIRSKNLNTGTQHSFTRDNIISIERFNQFYKFNTAPENSGYFLLDTEHLTEGDKNTLQDHLLQSFPHLNNKKIPKAKSQRPFIAIICILSVIYFLLSLGCVLFFGHTLELEAQTPHQMDAVQSAQVLENLGIQGITEEMIADCQRFSAYGGSSVPYLLGDVGYGHYDDDWNWHPSGNGVYSFDLEYFEVSGMYEDFLSGINDLSNGSFQITNIQEELFLGSYELGIGCKKVSFEINSDRYTFYPVMIYDWMDIRFADNVTEIINQYDDAMDLYYLYSNSTSFSVFYRDAAWADEFYNLTGFYLINRLS